MDGSEKFSLIARRIGSADPNERLGAVCSLKGIENVRAFELLTTALGDPDQQVRTTALRIIVEAEQEEPTTMAVQALTRPAIRDLCDWSAVLADMASPPRIRLDGTPLLMQLPAGPIRPVDPMTQARIARIRASLVSLDTKLNRSSSPYSSRSSDQGMLGG